MNVTRFQAEARGSGQSGDSRPAVVGGTGWDISVRRPHFAVGVWFCRAALGGSLVIGLAVSSARLRSETSAATARGVVHGMPNSARTILGDVGVQATGLCEGSSASAAWRNVCRDSGATRSDRGRLGVSSTGLCGSQGTGTSSRRLVRFRCQIHSARSRTRPFVASAVSRPAHVPVAVVASLVSPRVTGSVHGDGLGACGFLARPLEHVAVGASEVDHATDGGGKRKHEPLI